MPFMGVVRPGSRSGLDMAALVLLALCWGGLLPSPATAHQTRSIALENYATSSGNGKSSGASEIQGIISESENTVVVALCLPSELCDTSFEPCVQIQEAFTAAPDENEALLRQHDETQAASTTSSPASTVPTTPLRFMAETGAEAEALCAVLQQAGADPGIYVIRHGYALRYTGLFSPQPLAQYLHHARTVLVQELLSEEQVNGYSTVKKTPVKVLAMLSSLSAGEMANLTKVAQIYANHLHVAAFAEADKPDELPLLATPSYVLLKRRGEGNHRFNNDGKDQEAFHLDNLVSSLDRNRHERISRLRPEIASAFFYSPVPAIVAYVVPKSTASANLNQPFRQLAEYYARTTFGLNFWVASIRETFNCDLLKSAGSSCDSNEPVILIHDIKSSPEPVVYDMKVSPSFDSLKAWVSAYLSRRDDETSTSQGFVSLAQSFSRQRKYKEASHAYEEAIRLDPDNIQAYTAFSAMLHETGNQRAALRYTEQALERDPSSEKANLRLAALLADFGQYNTSAQFADIAIQEGLAYEAIVQKGTSLFLLGDYPGAASAFAAMARLSTVELAHAGQLDPAKRHAWQAQRATAQILAKDWGLDPVGRVRQLSYHLNQQQRAEPFSNPAISVSQGAQAGLPEPDVITLTDWHVRRAISRNHLQHLRVKVQPRQHRPSQFPTSSPPLTGYLFSREDIPAFLTTATGTAGSSAESRNQDVPSYNDDAHQEGRDYDAFIHCFVVSSERDGGEDWPSIERRAFKQQVPQCSKVHSLIGLDPLTAGEQIRSSLVEVLFIALDATDASNIDILAATPAPVPVLLSDYNPYVPCHSTLFPFSLGGRPVHDGHGNSQRHITAHVVPLTLLQGVQQHRPTTHQVNGAYDNVPSDMGILYAAVEHASAPFSPQDVQAWLQISQAMGRSLGFVVATSSAETRAMMSKLFRDYGGSRVYFVSHVAVEDVSLFLEQRNAPALTLGSYLVSGKTVLAWNTTRHWGLVQQHMAAAAAAAAAAGVGGVGGRGSGKKQEPVRIHIADNLKDFVLYGTGQMESMWQEGSTGPMAPESVRERTSKWNAHLSRPHHHAAQLRCMWRRDRGLRCPEQEE